MSMFLDVYPKSPLRSTIDFKIYKTNFNKNKIKITKSGELSHLR